MKDRKSFLNTTHRTIFWFKKAHDNEELEVKPPFQRNPVWVTRQKSYLIDSILNCYPIPEIYMQEFIANDDAKYIIVDGQQRIRAVLEFLQGEYEIDGKDSPDWADMKYDDLSSEEKKRILEYNFVVRVLPEMDDSEIRSIFQRLNKNVVALNKQELRQATYWGPFINLMKKISDMKIWTKIDIFTQNDIRRMLDVEYVSEVSIAILHGLQNKKASLDKYYEIYEQEFEQEDFLLDTFETVLNEIYKILPKISDTRWSKKSDFYSLFLVFAKYIKELPFSSDERTRLGGILLEFGENLDDYTRTDIKKKSHSDNVLLYSAGIRASSDLGSRKRREEALIKELGLDNL